MIQGTFGKCVAFQVILPLLNHEIAARLDKVPEVGILQIRQGVSATVITIIAVDYKIDGWTREPTRAHMLQLQAATPSVRVDLTEYLNAPQ